MKPVQHCTIALIAPSDVAADCQAVKDAIEVLRTRTTKLAIDLQVVDWKGSPLGFNPSGVQAGIESYLNLSDCDFVIAIFWKRYGVIDEPPYSRTAREVRLALEASRSNSRPQLLVYFATRAYEPSEETLSEHQKVLAFKREMDAEKVKYEEYQQLGDLKISVYHRISSFLDGFSVGPIRAWSCGMTCTRPIVRAEGYTERVGDIRIQVARISVFLGVNLTSRLDHAGISEIELVSERNPSRAIANGKLTGHAGVEFDRIALDESQANLDDVFVVKNIRLDATQTGVGPGSGPVAIHCVVEVEVENHGSTPFICRETISLCAVAASMRFSAIVDRKSGIVVPDRIVRSLTLHFQPSFPGALLDQQEEAGWFPNGGAYGSMLRIRIIQPPQSWEAYSTRFDLSFAQHGTIKAAAVRTDDKNIPLDRRVDSSTLLWGGSIPMVRLKRVWNNFSATWEILSSSDHGTEEVVFGIALVGPGNDKDLETVQITWDRSPSFSFSEKSTRTASADLPLPRFGPGPSLVDLKL